ncbi:restriction endonuclease subunit S [Bacillus cereus]|uniref:restriction endonuclease subunit S n=1 Tax=Bacillus cereus TaxID=1396 RepID=UPI0024058E9D|nr:restriction endonuclease subunit S [Bacillus cereus]MDF9506341.1 restriction endonuclease subunit S [Bacillus cereus]MDF9593472.1 restriction endonuclease subunit S [Bacillus cereus]MDF9605424.1 restriction endonuclease subunit S [Bacillus cereus]MDF9656590.1 restriction endonuclease subunit S [Bacillus cereus]
MSETNQKSTTWNKFTLKDVMDEKKGFKRGPFGGALKKEIFVENGYAVYEQQHVINNNFKNIRYFINEEKYKELASFNIKKDDILVSCSGTVGRIALVPVSVQEGVINQALLRLRPNPKILSSKYAWFLLNSDFMQSKMVEMSHGSTLKNIVAVKELKNIEILIPSLFEQDKISAILSSVDEAIEKTEVIIEQTEEVKKGLMQNLFTKGIEHTEFKKTEIGEIPAEWEMRKLEEVTLPKDGVRRGPFGGALKKEIFVGEGYAVYEQQHVIYNDMGEFRYFIDEKKFLEMKAFEVFPGDILISCSGTVGKVALVPENAKKGVINQALLRLRLDNKLLLNLYAWYLLNSEFMQSKMTDMSHGSTLKNIVGMKELRDIVIPVPPLDEQMEIVSILTSVFQKYQIEQQRLLHLQNIKKGLMQSLLTGKVRVKFDEAEVTQV